MPGFVILASHAPTSSGRGFGWLSMGSLQGAGHPKVLQRFGEGPSMQGASQTTRTLAGGNQMLLNITCSLLRPSIFHSSRRERAPTIARSIFCLL